MMKSLIGTFVVVMSLLLATTSANAQEMSFRSGVVTGVTPIQVQAQQASTGGGGSRVGGALGRMFGRAVGKAVSRASGEYSYEAYDVANSAAQDVAQGATSGGDGKQVTAYMVMIKFDDGSESAIQSAQATTLRVGSRVRVFGSGSSAQIVAE
jgi:outer membrane lipoprotein SlyB